MAKTPASTKTHSHCDGRANASSLRTSLARVLSLAWAEGRHRQAHRPRQARRAFSLIELTVVILVLGILSAASVPRFADAYRQHCVSAAAERIVADLVRAQSAAYGSSNSKTVSFDVSASSYQITGVRPLDRSSGTYVVDLKLSPYESSLVTVWNQSGLQTITFNGYGIPDKGGSIVVACGSAQKVVLVSASTGTAVVQ